MVMSRGGRAALAQKMEGLSETNLWFVEEIFMFPVFQYLDQRTLIVTFVNIYTATTRQ
jgi:hypothetical protein